MDAGPGLRRRGGRGRLRERRAARPADARDASVVRGTGDDLGGGKGVRRRGKSGGRSDARAPSRLHGGLFRLCRRPAPLRGPTCTVACDTVPRPGKESIMNRRECVISTLGVAVALFTPFRIAGQKKSIEPDLTV